MTAPGWRHRVRVRVTAAAVLVTLVGAVVGAVLFVGGLHTSLERSLLDATAQQADVVIAHLEQGGTVTDAAVTGKRDIVIQVLADDGSVLATDHPQVTSPIRTSVGTAKGVRIGSLVDSYAVVAHAGPDGRLVVAALSEEEVQRATRVAAWLIALCAPVGLALVGVVVWLAVGRALRPVEEMRRGAEAISSDHLRSRLTVPAGDDEIPHLAVTLNEMLDRVAQAQAKQQGFVAAASHELRTPLAVLRQTAENAQRHPDLTTVTELADAVWAEEHRMERLVQSLLVLTRGDETTFVSAPGATGVDLDDLVFDEVQRQRRLHSDAFFNASRVSAGAVPGDPSLWTQVVSNLLSNAVRHGTHLEISLGVTTSTNPQQQGWPVVRLVVEDDGPGVPEADRLRIFDRFARVDQARSRDQGGAGLGLAIVAQVVHGHGGSVWVEPGSSGGARFVVEVPEAPAYLS